MDLIVEFQVSSQLLFWRTNLKVDDIRSIIIFSDQSISFHEDVFNFQITIEFSLAKNVMIFFLIFFIF